MRNSGFNKTFALIGFALLITVQTVIFLQMKPGSRGVIGFFSVIIVILAVVAGYFSWVQFKNTEKRVKNLPEDYKMLYVDANEIIRTSTLKKNEKNEIMTMVLEIFEHASLEKRIANDVIKGNLKQFLKGFIDASGGKTSLLYLFSYSSLIFVGYLLLMKAYLVIRTGNIEIETLQTELLDSGLIVTYGIIAYVFFPWQLLVMQKAARERWRGVKRLWTIVPFSIPIGLVSALILVDSPGFNRLVNYPIPIFNSLGSILAGCLIILVCIVMMKYASSKFHIKRL